MTEAVLHVTLNGEVMRLPRGASLADLVRLYGEDPGAVATAVNDRFIARADRDRTALSEGDAVSFFKAIVGG